MKKTYRLSLLALTLATSAAFAAPLHNTQTQAETIYSHTLPASHSLTRIFPNFKADHYKADLQKIDDNKIKSSEPTFSYHSNNYDDHLIVLGDVLNFSQPMENVGDYKLTVTAYRTVHGKVDTETATHIIHVLPVAEQKVKVATIA